MKTSLLTCLLALIFLGAFASESTSPELQSYVGTWINERADIAKITVEVKDGEAWARAWRSCDQGLCEIGWVNAEPFAKVGGMDSELALTFSLQMAETEAHLLLQRQGDRLGVKVVSIRQESGHPLRTTYMAFYDRPISANPALTGSIIGQVTGPAKTLASTVQVVLTDAQGRLISRQPLRANGYELQEVPAGSYHLRFEEQGGQGILLLEPGELEIEVYPGETTKQSIRLY
ncbi:MAG: hypothetical protein AAF399_29655 [Bacteroidota bacterium]